MPSKLTAPERLDLLIPWLNGTFDVHHFEGANPEPVAVWTDYAAIRRAVATFVGSFDGSEGAGHVAAVAETPELTDEELDQLEAHSLLLLEQGFGEAQGLTFPTDALRFAVRSAGREAPKKRGSVVAGGRAAERAYRAAGAYVLEVSGPMPTLVPFLVAHLLTLPGMVAVKRCLRPGCDHFVVAMSGRRGAPKKFCSRTCGTWNAEMQEQQRGRRRRKR